MGWHSGERALQEGAGFRKGDALRRVIQNRMPQPARAFINGQTLAFITTIDRDGRPWVSPLAGRPGSFGTPDEHTLTVDASALRDERVIDHVTHNNAVGLIAIDFATRRRMRLNGRAELESDGTLVVHADEVYSNCPKYIQARVATDPDADAEKLGSAVVSYELTDEQQRWIADADTLFIGSRHPEAGADASHRGGEPGFVHVASATCLQFPDYSGNFMFQTLGNLIVDERVSLLFVDFDSGAALQVVGRAHIHQEQRDDMPGSERWVEVFIDRVVEMANAIPYAWQQEERSPFNPQ